MPLRVHAGALASWDYFETAAGEYGVVSCEPGDTIDTAFGCGADVILTSSYRRLTQTVSRLSSILAPTSVCAMWASSSLQLGHQHETLSEPWPQAVTVCIPNPVE